MTNQAKWYQTTFFFLEIPQRYDSQIHIDRPGKKKEYAELSTSDAD
jgi:hypothetical protein